VTLQNTTVSGNSGIANALTGTVQGGGIFAVDETANNGPPGGPVILINSSILLNLLSANHGITPQGGGIFDNPLTSPVTRTNTLIAGNIPDQCDGCCPTRPNPNGLPGNREAVLIRRKPSFRVVVMPPTAQSGSRTATKHLDRSCG